MICDHAVGVRPRDMGWIEVEWLRASETKTMADSLRADATFLGWSQHARDDDDINLLASAFVFLRHCPLCGERMPEHHATYLTLEPYPTFEP